MNLKFNKKNYKSNLVEFSDLNVIKKLFFLKYFFLFIILYI